MEVDTREVTDGVAHLGHTLVGFQVVQKDLAGRE